MSTSIIELQRTIFLRTIRETCGNDWKVLVVDQQSRRLLDNVAKEDDVLNCNITNIEQIEDRRQTQPDTDAVYLLSPLPHIVESLKADINRKRYRRAFLIWTSLLPRLLGEDLFKSESRRALIADSKSLNIDFFARESHLITFREPWAFQVLYNSACDGLVKNYLDGLTQKIVSVCVSLGEYPLIKYYRPKSARHDAGVLCTHLASFVQNALDEHARNPRNNFPPQVPSPRPRATLVITDRSMDLMSPLLHELTYQAMAMDLLPIQDDNDRIVYRNVVRRGQEDESEKDFELNDNDKLWIENRHLHMKDLLVKLSDDFKRFQSKNSQFADNDGQPVSVNTIKDMLAGLPEFQEGKDMFSLHIDMAEKCAKIFQDHKLMDLTSVEQSLATGLDEDNRKPKNLADQLVRMLDDDSVSHEDRLRLLVMYIIYRDGILGGDIEKLRCHGMLSQTDGEIIYNFRSLGARVAKDLQDIRAEAQQQIPPPQPLFAPKVIDYAPGEEVSLSRFEPALKYLLEQLSQGTLENSSFPSVKPHLDNQNPQPTQSQASLRSAGQPTWARTRPSANKPRQRIMVFMAGGATYAEARACYEISQQLNKEVFLMTSHMLTPKMFLRQVHLLSHSRRQLGLPMDSGPPRLPAWMADAPPESLQPKPQPQQTRVPNGGVHAQSRPPTDAMQNLNLQPPRLAENGTRPSSAPRPTAPAPSTGPVQSQSQPDSGKLKKEKKEKKHLGLFKKH